MFYKRLSDVYVCDSVFVRTRVAYLSINFLLREGQVPPLAYIILAGARVGTVFYHWWFTRHWARRS